MKLFPMHLCLIGLITACSTTTKIEWVSTMEKNPWQTQTTETITEVSGTIPDYIIDTKKSLQTIDGFGACFNELGWTSLSLLDDSSRQSIMKELFKPGEGANLTICRMPIGANDFSRDWYSYNETEGDFEMTHFCIENDQETLIPFIKNALKYNPHLKIWASPWSPPIWMKENRHYACQPLDTTFFNSLGENSIKPEQVRKEGVNMFIPEEKYYKAYALYFTKFIESYRDNGIDIFMVMPQNEFNSCQPFPSCTWKSSTLAEFVGKYLAPAMNEIGVDVMFGTMERPDEAMVDTVLNDPDCKKYINGVGLQWAGKYALPKVHKNYPEIKIIQTEQECGDGLNDWEGCVYSWHLMKYFMENGVNVYNYWNISLEQGGMSRWGWTQNSLITVDPVTFNYKYTNEYYLLKHFSHYIQSGAHLLSSKGSDENIIAFKNPDGRYVMIVYNPEEKLSQKTIKIGDKLIAVAFQPQSFNTIVL